MITGEDLIAAAATIGSMPQAALSQRLGQLEEERRRRSGIAAVRQSAELDSLDLDEAAYQLARQHHADGNLAAAARWYRAAAANDYADAALLLGNVLEQLAEKYLTGPSTRASVRDELSLVTEAARWYIEAYGAGHLEAAERVDPMIARHDPNRVRPVPAEPPPHGREPEPAACEDGGLQAVLEESELEAAVRHFRDCVACQQELISHGGLLPTIRPSPPLDSVTALPLGIRHCVISGGCHG